MGIRVPKTDDLVSAAERNLTIQLCRSDPASQMVAKLCSRDAILRNPPCRFEFEYFVAVGDLPSVRRWAKFKTQWGRLLAVTPILPHDPWDPYRLVGFHKSDSPRQERYRHRNRLKECLGAEGRHLVSLAKRLSRGQFLLRLTGRDRLLLSQRLELSPTRFWREVRRGPNTSTRE